MTFEQAFGVEISDEDAEKVIAVGMKLKIYETSRESAVGVVD